MPKQRKPVSRTSPKAACCSGHCTRGENNGIHLVDEYLNSLISGTKGPVAITEMVEYIDLTSTATLDVPYCVFDCSQGKMLRRNANGFAAQAYDQSFGVTGSLITRVSPEVAANVGIEISSKDFPRTGELVLDPTNDNCPAAIFSYNIARRMIDVRAAYNSTGSLDMSINNDGNFVVAHHEAGQATFYFLTGVGSGKSNMSSQEMSVGKASIYAVRIRDARRSNSADEEAALVLTARAALSDDPSAAAALEAMIGTKLPD